VSQAAEGRADWPYLQNGAVTLFWRRARLNEAMRALDGLGYRLVEADCETVHGFCLALGTGLDWVGQFGYQPWNGNLDALNDGLRGDIFSPTGGLAICLTGFHQLVAADRDFALKVLDVMEGGARDRLVEGKRLAVLVQTDDARFETPSLGGRPATWNEAEWLNASRRP